MFTNWCKLYFFISFSVKGVATPIMSKTKFCIPLSIISRRALNRFSGFLSIERFPEWHILSLVERVVSFLGNKESNKAICGIISVLLFDKIGKC